MYWVLDVRCPSSTKLDKVVLHAAMEIRQYYPDVDRLIEQLNPRWHAQREFDRLCDEHAAYVANFLRRQKLIIWFRYFCAEPRNALLNSYKGGVPQKYKWPPINLLDWTLAQIADEERLKYRGKGPYFEK